MVACCRRHHEENSVLMLRALIESNNIGLGEYGLHPEYDLPPWGGTRGVDGLCLDWKLFCGKSFPSIHPYS